MGLSAEEKHARLREERTFLAQLLEAALQGRFPELERLTEDYSLRHAVPKEQVLAEFRDGQGRTSLHFACQSQPSVDGTDTDAKDIVEELLRPGWLPAAGVQRLLRLADAEGFTPLLLAAQLPDRSRAEQRIRVILRAAGDGATDDIKRQAALEDLALAKTQSGATALHYAAAAAATAAAVRALCEAGPAARNVWSQRGGTPLHWAAAASSAAGGGDEPLAETIAALLDCGADWNAHNSTSFPPLVYALASDHAPRAMLLLEQARDRGIDAAPTLHYALPDGTTPLHMAADLNMVGVLALMLELLRDASVLDRRNGRGLTARELAAAEGHVGCVLLLQPEGQRTEADAAAFCQEVKLRNLTVQEPIGGAKASAPIEPPPKAQAEPDAIETAAQQEAARVAEVAVDDAARQRALELKAQGNAEFAKKEYAQALEFYTQAIEADPTDATFYSNRSACHIHLQQPTQALRDAVVCRHLRPDWPKAAYRMALARRELGRYEDAAVAAWEGLQQDQGNDELQSLLRQCVKLGRKQHQAAQEGKR